MALAHRVSLLSPPPVKRATNHQINDTSFVLQATTVTATKIVSSVRTERDSITYKLLITHTFIQQIAIYLSLYNINRD